MTPTIAPKSIVYAWQLALLAAALLSALCRVVLNVLEYSMDVIPCCCLPPVHQWLPDQPRLELYLTPRLQNYVVVGTSPEQSPGVR